MTATRARDAEPKTRYAQKRRLLREHRRKMRIMDELIEENGLGNALENRLIEETGNTNFWLGEDSEMDEASDASDPELELSDEVEKLRQEEGDRQNLIAAVGDATVQQKLALEVKRARMEAEDLRSQLDQLQRVTKTNENAPMHK